MVSLPRPGPNRYDDPRPLRVFRVSLFGVDLYDRGVVRPGTRRVFLFLVDLQGIENRLYTVVDVPSSPLVIERRRVVSKVLSLSMHRVLLSGSPKLEAHRDPEGTRKRTDNAGRLPGVRDETLPGVRPLRSIDARFRPPTIRFDSGLSDGSDGTSSLVERRDDAKRDESSPGHRRFPLRFQVTPFMCRPQLYGFPYSARIPCGVSRLKTVSLPARPCRRLP